MSIRKAPSGRGGSCRRCHSRSQRIALANNVSGVVGAGSQHRGTREDRKASKAARGWLPAIVWKSGCLSVECIQARGPGRRGMRLTSYRVPHWGPFRRRGSGSKGECELRVVCEECARRFSRVARVVVVGLLRCSVLGTSWWGSCGRPVLFSVPWFPSISFSRDSQRTLFRPQPPPRLVVAAIAPAQGDNGSTRHQHIV
jgi:hypothetical protein